MKRIVGNTCDTCASQEGRHYCLLHSRQMKNMDGQNAIRYTSRTCDNCGYRVPEKTRLASQPKCERPIDNMDDACHRFAKWIANAPDQARLQPSPEAGCSADSGQAVQSGDLLERCYCPRCGGPGGASKPPKFGDYPVADGVWLSCPRCAIWWAVSVGGPTGQAESSNPLIAQPPRDVSELYHELLYAVAQKFPGESRHKTALRYIREREERAGEAGSCKQNKEITRKE